MEFQEILTLIEKVSNSSLTSFSLVENQDGIQISMKKEKKVIKMQKVRETEGEAVQIWAENREVSTQESFLKTGEKIEKDGRAERARVPGKGIPVSNGGKIFLQRGWKVSPARGEGVKKRRRDRQYHR